MADIGTGQRVGLQTAAARVPWALNPLVVGSTPARPTNTDKGLARDRWAFVFLGRVDSVGVCIPRRAPAARSAWP